ncbi:MAG: hypothetical protein QOH10_1352 [Actinomycetota bacterium]|jgi:hypothetical protein|nr:hypothetical protein [Actinomycetota bacterium]
MTWPAPEFDAVGRLRVVAAAYPSAGISEISVNVPFDDAWQWITNFERNTPRMDTIVRKVRLRRIVEGEYRMLVWLRWSPLPWPFRVTVEPGFCMMNARARAFLVLMAAVSEGPGRTRYAHAEGVPVHRLGFLQRRFQRMVEADLARLASNIPN